ncbi:MAG: glycosyltransferase family 1 protein [Mesorhizobium sp.]|uniref:glycosyltransferase n=1 Tax=Mesorhizobium sp. TaxID=1871066 RepID=UPI000FE7632C|nr:glycosyltransferase [Mesorhizobium sp.]RWB73920.1 MAG: glycosyltransferase family 1 protein [Mesorhizobium sp.]
MDAAIRIQTTVKARKEQDLLICFSHLRWNFVYQRPQHILTRASKEHQIVYFEEPVFEECSHSSVRFCDVAPGIRVATPLLPIGTSPARADAIQRRYLDRIIASTPHAQLTAWYYTPMALRFSAHVNFDVCVYDCMDELAAFKNAPAQLALLERTLFERADVVFTGGLSLFEAKRCQHRAIYPFPSSIDVNHFHKARAPGEEPADQLAIPHPRVGFFGVIDERLDIDLVAQASSTMPDVHFVMLGPVVKIDPDILPKANNLHWLGSKAYKELPAYLRHWDVGWMPFALNEATRFISPTKTPEFLAAGLPVVSTAIVDVVRSYAAAGLVDIADAEDIEAKLRSALAQPREMRLPAVDAYLANMSWQRTWDAMAAHIRKASASKKVVPFRRSA